MSERVLISTSSFGKVDPAPLEDLRARGLAVELNPHGRPLTEAEIAEWLPGAAGLIAGTEPLTAAVFAGAPSLRVVSRVGAGLDSVDLAAAKAAGIAVYSTPRGPAVAVAELTVGLILAALRGIPRADAQVRAGAWEKRMGSLLSGRTVGIVGFGNVGRAVAERLAAFGCAIVAYDPFVDCGEAAVTLDELLARADVVTLHVPFSEETRSLMDRERIGRMRPGALLVNTARGGLVDEDALADVLREGRLGGAAIDVFESEPYSGPLASLDNVVLTPHIGSYAAEARALMEREAVDNLLAGLGLA